ncbi:MAG: hypothetical protein JO159_19070 [Acidobacteria bacterium]|nr:hypothetical protein [Acidobacteriota bacterium]
MHEIKKTQDQQQHEFEFLHAEVLTGLTFSGIALQASHEHKKSRKRNAKQAYDALLGFLPGTILTPDQEADIKSKLAELKGELRLLGEAV